jgi:phospholipid transport system substrate-binding protein
MIAHRPTLFVASFALLAALAGSSPAQGQAKAEAQRFLQRKQEAVMDLLRTPAGSASAKAKRKARLEELLEGFLDYEEVSKRSLGDRWDEQSVAERKKFTRLLRELVEKGYRKNLERTLDYQVRYEGSASDDGTVLVRTTARSRKNPRAPAISIDYRLHESGGAWRVYDIVTDGVSMIRNYRSQFRRIIDKEGWSGLIDRMENKLQG